MKVKFAKIEGTIKEIRNYLNKLIEEGREGLVEITIKEEEEW